MADSNAAVSIDFWNTIVKTQSGGESRLNARLEALGEISERYLDEISTEEISKASQKTKQHFDDIWLNQQRTPTPTELTNHILDYLDIPATEEERKHLTTKFEDSMWAGPPELTDGLKEILPELSDRYSLAVISDTMYSPGRVIRQYLEEKEILNYFQCFVFSDETGYSKPNTKAYKTVLDQTGSKATSSYHIGDLIETDVTGAKNIGMQAVLFTGASQPNNDADGQVEPDHICKSWQEVADIML